MSERLPLLAPSATCTVRGCTLYLEYSSRVQVFTQLADDNKSKLTLS